MFRAGILLLVLSAMAEPVHIRNFETTLSDFSLPKLNGEMVSLSDFKGKNPVLLVFFATWCLPCNVEVPLVNKIHREYGAKGLVLLAIDVQESKMEVEQWAKKRGVEYPILLDQKGSVVLDYGIYSVPTNILINFDGEVAFWHNVLPNKRVLDAVFRGQ
ncbi:MAG: TlpA family protein disulfide reductase [Candidatus Omnitrophica bacterium]|nr:TlpA family protein disulfide reductase [Candidatus Omnitrophota bacterium]